MVIFRQEHHCCTVKKCHFGWEFRQMKNYDSYHDTSPCRNNSINPLAKTEPSQPCHRLLPNHRQGSVQGLSLLAAETIEQCHRNCIGIALMTINESLDIEGIVHCCIWSGKIVKIAWIGWVWNWTGLIRIDFILRLVGAPLSPWISVRTFFWFNFTYCWLVRTVWWFTFFLLCKFCFDLN